MTSPSQAGSNLFQDPSLPQAPARTLRILLVDDSATMRLFLKAQLGQAWPSAQVTEAEDGKSALRALGSGAVDLVVTDLQMPGMDGQSLVQLLRRNPLLRRKPVLVISAALEEARGQDWAEGPGILLLAKPVTLDELRGALRSLLGA